MTQELTKRQIAARKAAETRRKNKAKKHWWMNHERNVRMSKEVGLYIEGDFPIGAYPEYAAPYMQDPFFLPEVPTEMKPKDKKDIYKTLRSLEKILDIPHVSSKRWKEDETVTIHYLDDDLHGHILDLSSDWELEQRAGDFERQGLKPFLALKYPGQAYPVFLCWDIRFHPPKKPKRYMYGAEVMSLPCCSYMIAGSYRGLGVSVYTYRPYEGQLGVYFVADLLIEAHEGVIYPSEALPYLPEQDGIMPWDTEGIRERFFSI